MEEALLVDYVLWAVLLVVAVAVTFSRDLIKSLVYLAIFSLITAGLYMSMEAPDVAITEAAIGAAISTLFFLAALQIVGTGENSQRHYVVAAATLLTASFIFMCLAIIEMPLYADPDSPATIYLADYYLQNSVPETGVTNVVTSVLASYRGFDTLGEVYVILAAGISVLLILPLNMWNKSSAKGSKK